MVRQERLMTSRQDRPTGGIRVRGIFKRFGELQVLRDVNLEAHPGEIHAVVGENGAGKTTLMRIIAGLERGDAGTVEIAGATMPRAHNAAQAITAGVGLVPQHCEVAPTLTVLESLSLGRESTRWGLYDRRRVRREGQRVADSMGFAFDWNSPAESLGMAQRQRLELVRLLMRDAAVLILDEPTTVLTSQEIDSLFDALRPLAAAGRTILFITHKLVEVRQLADNITVLRGGSVVGSVAAKEVDNSAVARMMIGQLSAPPVRDDTRQPGAVRLQLTGVTLATTGPGMHPLQDVSFAVRAGEIFGIAGVEGNGQEELVDTIAGRHRPSSGTVELDGTAVGNLSVREHRKLGLAVIPADRMHEGANLAAPVWETATAIQAASTARTILGVLPLRSLRRRGADVAERVGVTASPVLATGSLSGGNIQRIIIGRELDGDPSVVVSAHPTRGVDIRGIAFIHQQLFDMRAHGKAVLVLSADLDELTAIADRISILAGGRLLDDFAPGERDAAEIGLLMSGSGSAVSSKPAHGDSHAD